MTPKRLPLVLLFIACAIVVLLFVLEPVHAAQGVQAAQGAAAPLGLVQLVAVQMTLDLDDYWSRDAFASKIRRLMEQVARRITPGLPTLVVFPEDVGLMLAVQGMRERLQGVESIEGAIERAVKAHLIPLAVTKWRRKLSWVPAFYLYKHRTIAETYFDVFSTMAKEYGVYLVAGSAVLPPYRIDDGVVQWRQEPLEYKVYNTSYLFGPDGKVIGRQHKVYLIELEQEAALDLNSGDLDSLQVFETPLGKVGIAICLDAFQDDVIDRLAALGADILVQPSANPGPWDLDQQIDWLRSSHQKTFVERRFEYAVNPMMNGPLWEIDFYGQSSIVARSPGDLGDSYDQTDLSYMHLAPAGGFIRVASSDRSEEVLVARVPHPASR